MKKYFKIISLLIVVFLLSGCLKINTNMVITNDKNIRFNLVYGVNQTKLSNIADTTVGDNINVESEKKKLEPLGYTVKEYNKVIDGNRWIGVEISKELGSLDELSSSDVSDVFMLSFKDNEPISFKNGEPLFNLNDGVYSASLFYDLTDPNNGDYSNYKKIVDLSYTITLPVETLSNNATYVSKDGKTLTWILELGKMNQVLFTFDFKQHYKNHFMSFIIVLIVLLIVLSIVSFFILNNKKKNKLPEIVSKQ